MTLIDQTPLLRLRELAAGDDSFVVSVIDAFLPQLATTPGALREALAAGNGAAVADLAHSLKGSAGNVGAEAVSRLSLRIEQLGRAGDLQAVPRLVDELESTAAETAQAFRAERAKLG